MCMNTNDTNAATQPATLTCTCGTEWATDRLLDGHTRWNTHECLDCFISRTKAGTRAEWTHRR